MDVEREIASFLMARTGVKTVLEVPETRPAEFLSVELTGQSGARFATRYTLAIQAWAQTRKRAAEIAHIAMNASYSADTVENLFAPSVSNTYRFPDPDSKQERYQMTVEVTVCE